MYGEHTKEIVYKKWFELDVPYIKIQFYSLRQIKSETFHTNNDIYSELSAFTKRNRIHVTPILSFWTHVTMVNAVKLLLFLIKSKKTKQNSFIKLSRIHNFTSLSERVIICYKMAPEFYCSRRLVLP